jgi:hypothetical protein
MKRDPDLIRSLLFYAERHQDGNQPLPFPVESPVENWLEGYTIPDDLRSTSVPNFLRGHLQLMIDDGLAEGTVHVDQRNWENVTFHGTLPDPWFDKVLPSGHDLLDAIRKDSVWTRVKEKVSKVGGSVSIDLLKSTATKIVQDMLT